MNFLENILSAVIGLIIGAFGKWLWPYIIDGIRTRFMTVPNLDGSEWKCVWFSGEQEYEKDTVKLDSCGTRVKGTGKASDENKGTYKIQGSFKRPNIYTLTYDFDNRNDLSGVIILTIDPLRKTMSGFWYGYTIEGIVQGGKVTWVRK